ncbi:hypothetical protein F4604DRAFT_1882719 [Suillus subluteus]|nr:hypothetical protein F4604DRAFT_1882719 [Suillus subluteus]
MSGDWAWQQADKIVEDPQTHGAAFVPIIIGSNKTTVSVATGQNDYYPLYLLIGNNIQYTHHNALALIRYLTIPKTEKKNVDDPTSRYRKFKKQLFHSSLSKIFTNLRPRMMTPEVIHCGNMHYQCVIFGLGPYIADYEEHVVLACMVKDWCGRCLAFPSNLDGGVSQSHEHTGALIDSVDFGLIKGTFKDHFVEWICQYLELEHGKTSAKAILDDIDQWYLQFSAFSCFDYHVLSTAIKGHVPNDMVWALQALLEFCYIVHHADVVTDNTLAELRDVEHFHTYCTIFQTTGIHFDISLPRQHSLAVKQPWQCSSKCNALSQMLLTNQYLDKLATARINFTMHGMLKGNHSSTDVPLCECPSYVGSIKVFHSAAVTFITPSDPSGITGMHHEHIHAVPSWHNGPGHFN